MAPMAETADLTALNIEARQQFTMRRFRRTLALHLQDLPDHALEGYPWLLLYQAFLHQYIYSNFSRASHYLDVAQMHFENADDLEGVLWTNAERTHLNVYDRDFKVGRIMARQALHIIDFTPEIATPVLRIELLLGLARCLIGFDQTIEALEAIDTIRSILNEETDPWIRHIEQIQFLRTHASLDMRQGRFDYAIEMIEAAILKAQDYAESAPFEVWCRYQLGLMYWRKGEFSIASQQLDTTRRQAEQWGHHALWGWTIAAQGHMLRDQDELAAAREAYRLAEGWGEEVHGPTFLFIREGKLAEARWACHIHLQLARHHESPVDIADSDLLFGLIELRTGHIQRAIEHIEQALSVYVNHGYDYALASARIYHAVALLSLQRSAEADISLEQALSILAREKSYNCAWWMPDIVEVALMRAIQQRIESQYTRRLLNHRYLHSLPPLTTLGAETPRTHHPSAELEIARQTQLSLLPEAPPLLPDLDIAGLSIPAENVGGDFFGYYTGDQTNGQCTTLSLALGDISGKGLQAALLTSGTVVALTSAVVGQPSPTLLLERVHTALHPLIARSRLNVGLSYTSIYKSRIEHHCTRWTLCTVNAGNIPPLIRRTNGQIEWLEAMGLPLGTVQLTTYHEACTDIQTGDLLIQISDGVIEAMNPQRELFGFERLEQTIACAPVNEGARAVVAHILTAVQTYASGALQHDDITIIVVLVRD